MMQEIKIAIRDYKEAKKGDILVYDGQKWQPVSSAQFLMELNKKIEKVEVLQTQVNVLKKQIARFLKEEL
jgi:hypothetical protein